MMGAILDSRDEKYLVENKIPADKEVSTMAGIRCIRTNQHAIYWKLCCGHAC